MNTIEPFFNDLSIYPLCSNEQEVVDRFSRFAEVLSFCSELGIRSFRIDKSFKNYSVTRDKHIYDYISDNRTRSDVKLILSMARKPYIDDETPQFDKYVDCDIKLLKENALVDAYGLSCAYVSNSFSIGFSSEPFWRDNHEFKLKIIIESEGASKEDSIFCISNLMHFEKQEFVSWYVSNTNISSVFANIHQLDKKEINLRDDHGKNRLEKIAQIILKEPYTTQVVNSLEFNSYRKSFIEEIDGALIYLRFVNSDRGYGMVIETVANSYLLNLYLAEDLRQKYQTRKV